AENDSRVYYLSDRSGTLNVHSFSVANPSDDRQVTSFKTHPVRFLSAANDGTLAFGYNGQIYIKRGTAEPVKVAITIASDSRSNDQYVVQISGGASGMSVSPNGKEVA